MHSYEVRPRKNKRGFDLISDALPFGRLWYGESNAVSNAISYAMHYNRSADAVIGLFPRMARQYILREPESDCSPFRIQGLRPSPSSNRLC
jgi:hypothetical protein